LVIQREAAYEFDDGLKDWKVKQHFFISGERYLKEALEALKL
jgi:hypothetical protein